MVGHRFLVGLNHVLDVLVLVAGPGEKLDRQDIGIGIDHPGHHPRALLRADFGEVAHARHEVAQKARIGGKPAHGRNGQPPIGQAHQADGGDAVNHDIPNRPHTRDGALAQRIACLHNAVGNAPGKVILEKRPALAHHMPVVLPAHHARKRAHHRVKAQQTVKQQGCRAQHQHENQHGQQHGHGVLQGSIAVGSRHQADQFANQHRGHGIAQSHQQATEQHGKKQAPRLRNEVPVKGNKAFGWCAGGRRCSGDDARLKIGKQRLKHRLTLPQPRHAGVAGVYAVNSK